MEKELLQTQIALFFNTAFSSLEFLALEIKKKLGETETQYLPVPSEAPVEFPRLILNYKIPDLKITFFKSRLDIVFDGDYNLENLEAILNITGQINSKLNRIGVVKTYFSKKDAFYLKTLLPQTKIEGLDVKEVGLNINVRKVISSYQCNSIERIFPGSISKEDVAPRTGLIVQRDCNTIVETLLPDNLAFTAIRELISELILEASSFVLI